MMQSFVLQALFGYLAIVTGAVLVISYGFKNKTRGRRMWNAHLPIALIIAIFALLTSFSIAISIKTFFFIAAIVLAFAALEKISIWHPVAFIGYASGLLGILHMIPIHFMELDYSAGLSATIAAAAVLFFYDGARSSQRFS